MQFHLSNFLTNNIDFLIKGMVENINIFPKRKGRNFISQLRTFILKIILLINTGIVFKEYNGQPKLLYKKDFSSVAKFPSGFCWDCFIFYWLKRNKKNINNECIIYENKRMHGLSSWSNSNFKDNFLFLLRYIKELKKIINLNEK